MQCGDLPLPQLFCEVQCSMLWFGRSWAMFNVSARFVISRLICYVLLKNILHENMNKTADSLAYFMDS